MAKFTCNKGKDWLININVSTLRKVKQSLDFDLLGGSGTPLDSLQKLAANPILLCDVLFVLCQDQAKERNITDEQFGEGLCGDAIEHASDALLEELVNFFPSQRREKLKRLLDKGKEAEKLMLDQADKAIDTLTPDKIIGDLFSKEQDQSESTPGDSPSEN